jgi:hypothetical protein
MGKRMGFGTLNSHSTPARAISASDVSALVQRVTLARVPPSGAITTSRARQGKRYIPATVATVLHFDNGTAGISRRLCASRLANGRTGSCLRNWLAVDSQRRLGRDVFESLQSPRVYGATTAGLLLGFLGLLIAGHTLAAVVVLATTLARYGYYLYQRYMV